MNWNGAIRCGYMRGRGSKESRDSRSEIIQGIQMFFRKTSLILCLFAGYLFTHTAIAAEGTVIAFSSTYTDLAHECRDKFNNEEEGQDMPLLCKGRDNYSVHVDFSACCDHIRVEGKRDFQLQLPPQTIGSSLNRTLEWRLANGKPFAVIFRIDRYRGDITMPPVQKAGSVLIIKGLLGFSNIDYAVDVKLHHNPNQVARKLADQGYMHKIAR